MEIIESHSTKFAVYRGTCSCGCVFECRDFESWEPWFGKGRLAGCPECDKVTHVYFHHRIGKLILPQGGSSTVPPKASNLERSSTLVKEPELSETGCRGYDG